MRGDLSGAGSSLLHGSGHSDPGLARSWTEVRGSLAASLPESTFRMWLAPLKPVVQVGDTLFLDGPENIRSWVKRRYEGLILEALRLRGSTAGRISFDLPARAGQLHGNDRAGPNPLHTFDRFVIGSGNHLAHAAALAVAEAPSEAYNPLFLYGAPGLGKTHLMGAIANYLSCNRPELEVASTSAEAFTTEFVSTLRSEGTADTFRERYRNIDVLLVDDVQFLAGKRHTEEEFFHTFNTLHEAGAQVILSADTEPSALEGLAERLSDRFEWGLSVELNRPDLATRLTVLGQLVAEAGIEAVDQEAVRLIASSVDSNLRQLRGALTRVVAEASLGGAEVTRELVSAALGRNGGAPPRVGGVTPREVLEAASVRFSVPVEDLQSRKRDRKTADARAVAMYVTREACGSTLSEIGALYGSRDHSTVQATISRVGDGEGTDPATTRALTALRAALIEPAGSLMEVVDDRGAGEAVTIEANEVKDRPKALKPPREAE